MMGYFKEKSTSLFLSGKINEIKTRKFKKRDEFSNTIAILVGYFSK